MTFPGKVPPPTPNPYVWSSGVDMQGREMRISIAWNTTTRNITGITVHRDPDCQFTRVLVGLGVGNSPNTTERDFDLSGIEGDFVVPQNRLNQLANRGLATVDDAVNTQITAA